MMKKIPYGRQTVGLREGLSAFRTTMGRSITQGPRIEELEERFCEFTNAKHAIAVSSGTAALHIAAIAANVSQSNETVVPGLTFAATASSVMLAGGHPSIVDIDQDTWNIDLSKVRTNTRNIVSVDFAGLPSGVTERITHRDAQVIEDCAHSLGARTPSGPVGGSSSTLMACFSLHPVKSITSGEGGVVTTNNSELASRLRELRSHGMDRDNSRFGWEYDIKSVGLNYRLTDIQAAIGIAQIGRLGKFIDVRNEIAERYRELLSNDPVGLPPKATKGYLHAYHLFPILLRDEEQRNTVYNYLHKQGILAQVHYQPLHRLSAFKGLRRHSENLDVTENVGSRILSLPIFPKLGKSGQHYVVECLRAALSTDGTRIPE